MTSETDYLELSLQAMMAKETELVAKGFHEGLARNAVERARGVAEYKSSAISPEIRQRAFYDILQSELMTAEVWAARERRFLDGSD